MSESLVTDSTGNSLKVGISVKYFPTGTTGNIVEIIKDEEGTWALVDKTNLYYRSDVLTVVKKSESKYLEEKKFTVEEINEAMEKQKEFVPTEMDHSNVESGG